MPIVTLIDILAILLIFFIVTTTFKTKESLVQVNLPRSTEMGEGTTAERRVPLALGKDGRISLGERVVPLESLAAALGEFRGPPPEGLFALTLPVPAGRYVLRASFRYGDAEVRAAEVRDAPRSESLKVVPRPTILLVKVRQELGTVSLSRLDLSASKPVPRGVGSVAFGLPEDGPERRLLFGNDVTVRVEAEGYVAAERRVRLLENPQVVEFDLVENAEDKVAIARDEVRKVGRLSPRYENDPVVLGDPRVKIELARVAMEKGAWVAVEAYVDDLRSSLEGREIPGGSESLFQGWHEHLRAVAGEAAGRGDVWRVREA
ncbi:MAG: biopolymer transporter ExbD, partial [Planctomycetaceae bacterium]|nr:biopolymer transporter ExbD [Planctomycetaceae bacterium]